MIEKPGIIERDELLTLIPHQGKMVLLSRIKTYDPEKLSLTAEYDLGPDCIFFDPALEGIPSWVSFECMAQSVSALSGILGRISGRKPRPGFILSVSSMEIKEPVLKAPALLRIDVQEDSRLEEVFIYHCKVFQGEQSAVSANLTVMETEDNTLLEKTREEAREKNE